MKYFKAIVAYTELIHGEATLDDHTLYCCSERSPRDEEIKDLFICSWPHPGARKFISCIWIEVRKEEIPTGTAHPYLP